MEAWKTKKTRCKGGALINLILLGACIGILAGVSVPALKHKNKRSAYRELLDTALSMTNSVEKCLGLERESTHCDTLEELVRHGFSSADIAVNPLIDDVEFVLDKGVYSITFTPPSENKNAPYVLPEHTLIREAEIIDRNGRPVIEGWTTNAQSGCLRNGFCG